jgi:hypothetical protein
MPLNAAPKPGDTYLAFSGDASFVEIPSLDRYSVDWNGELSVAAWMRPDVENFPKHEKEYVHWMGKGHRYGDQGDQEWACRMYNKRHCDRPQRSSFYVFNPAGRLGVGSYVQESVQVGQWRLLAASVDRTCTYLYRDGLFVECDTYTGPAVGTCPIMLDENDQQVVITPRHGKAPLRLGTLNFASYFQGGISRVRIWNGVLTPEEMLALYEHDEAPSNDLAADFRLNSDAGTNAVDSSAFGNHGRIQGAAWVIQT